MNGMEVNTYGHSNKVRCVGCGGCCDKYRWGVAVARVGETEVSPRPLGAVARRVRRTRAAVRAWDGRAGAARPMTANDACCETWCATCGLESKRFARGTAARRCEADDGEICMLRNAAREVRV